MAMNLRGQHGYAMVALLVSLSVMSILMTAAMPTWSQIARREKEAELVFRGQQYARAIGLFQRKSGPGVLPPSIDVLVDQHYLRRKYTDPITGDNFNLLSALTAVPGGDSANAQRPSSQPGLVGAVGIPTSASGRGNAGGIMGVASKSTATSLRIYNGRTHYNEWQFVYVAQTTRPGETAPGASGSSQRGGAPGSGFGQQPQPAGGGRGPAQGGNNPGRGGAGGSGSSQGQPPAGRGGGPAPFSTGPRPRL